MILIKKSEVIAIMVYDATCWCIKWYSTKLGRSVEQYPDPIAHQKLAAL